MAIKTRLAILGLAVSAISAAADVTTVQILAAADTDYGTNTVATMVSDVLTAPDGLATYQIAFDVTPPAGRSIRSGMTGTAGASTNSSWGVGPEDTLFKGSDNDRVEQIGNLRVLNVQANGGRLTLDSFFALSFSSVTLANAQSEGKDAVQVVVNGSTTQTLGHLAANPGVIDLEALVSVPVTAFGLETSTTSDLNKWSVNQIEVSVGIAWRADWMRGAWGALWLPETCYNGNIEGVTMDAFVDQISELRTLDYVQVGLTCPNVYSPVHMAPHDLIESLWQGDLTNGTPYNLVVPRASAADPFLSWLDALNAAGLNVEVYVNSYNLLARVETNIPSAFPDVSARWQAWCDTNETAQAFIASQPYHTNGIARRPYMFCYAEFVLKEYAVRYGDLIDAWCFDSADNIMEACGDNPESGVLEDQRIYEAFAKACHAGNPNAAIAFNNSTGDRVENPFSTATLFDDYTFGHPFGGAGDMVENETLYTYNYHVVEWLRDYAGYAFREDDRDWNDRVVGHFFPKQSTTSWNSGSKVCLTDEEFVEWNSVGLVDGGAITWGTPLVRVNLANSPVLTLQTNALAQLKLTDAYLSEFQSPGVPNWRRADTPLPQATIGQPYTCELTDGVDFWDSSGDAITDLIGIQSPAWLTIEESGSGRWVLSGIPTESDATDYSFQLQAMTGTTGTPRTVELSVLKLETVQTNIAIQAVANTDYGTSAVATLLSAVQTYGTATFQIACDVVPSSGTGIRRGNGGGETTSQSWGVYSSGEPNNDMLIFNGDSGESVDRISNLRVSNFAANGSSLTADHITDLSFKSVVIADGQSTHDRMMVSAQGVTNSAGGAQLATNPFDFDLELLAGSSPVSSFSLATGSSAADQTKNKWAVNSIQVSYTVDSVSVDRYASWASGCGLIGDDARSGADGENGGIGDGYDNLMEFALGMDPAVSDAGSRESIRTAVEGSTNWFEYVHTRRSDYAEQGLSYLLIASTNLLDSVRTTNTQDQILVGSAVDGYESVTNRYQADGSSKFIQLKIRQD
jgi:hypothetical protein